MKIKDKFGLNVLFLLSCISFFGSILTRNETLLFLPIIGLIIFTIKEKLDNSEGSEMKEIFTFNKSRGS